MYLEIQKTFGVGQGLWNRGSETETSGLVAGVPAFTGSVVDKKRNPTGYSESDDEDVPF
jgi:hypothetical protein